jgi:hypothetical protein
MPASPIAQPAKIPLSAAIARRTSLPLVFFAGLAIRAAGNNRDYLEKLCLNHKGINFV